MLVSDEACAPVVEVSSRCEETIEQSKHESIESSIDDDYFINELIQYQRVMQLVFHANYPEQVI